MCNINLKATSEQGRQWAQTKIVAVEVVRSDQILFKVGPKGLLGRLDVGCEKEKRKSKKTPRVLA